MRARMRFLFLVLLWMSLAEAYAQDRPDLDQKISISANDIPLDSMLDLISAKTSYFFAYNASLIPEDQRFTLYEKDKSVKYILNNLFIGTSLEYKVIEQQIVILRQKAPQSEDIAVMDRPSQIRVFGVVRDEDTKEPIEGVNAFLSRTMLGDATDPNGFYAIRNVPLGTYEIIFSHVGYGIKSQFVRMTEEEDFVLNISLKKLTHQLDEIEILSRYDKEWERNYRLFEKEFIGSSPSSSRCYILNPEVMEFEHDHETGVLKASANDVLQIENQALGYRISYVLELFEYENGRTRFVGKPRYETLQPDDPGELRRWRKARLKSYRGSMAHFLRSLSENTVQKEGFRIYGLNYLPLGNERQEKTVINSQKIISKGDFFFERKLSFREYLQVVYAKENENPAYIEEAAMLAQKEKSDVSPIMNQQLMNGALSKPQTSYIKLNINEVSIDARGFIYDQLAVTTYGYWSWERIAEALPFEYEP